MQGRQGSIGVRRQGRHGTDVRENRTLEAEVVADVDRKLSKQVKCEHIQFIPPTQPSAQEGKRGLCTRSARLAFWRMLRSPPRKMMVQPSCGSQPSKKSTVLRPHDPWPPPPTDDIQ